MKIPVPKNPEFEWLKLSRTLLYDAYWPPFHPKLAYTPEKGVAVAKEMNANAIRFGSIGKWALYQSSVMPRHPELGSRDLLRETIALARPEGIKTIAYVPVGHGLPRVTVESERPQWLYVLDDGKPPADSRHFSGPALTQVCPFGPYHTDIVKVLEELVGGYEIDALYIDGPYYSWISENTICQCEACRRLFKSSTGLELPSNAELHAKRKSKNLSARIEAHKGFVADGLTSLMGEIKRIASSKRLPLLFNGCAMEYLGSERQSSLSSVADGFLVESSMGGIKGIGRGLHQDKIVWNYTHRHSCWPRRSEPEIEATDELSAQLSAAQGATPIVSYAGRFLYAGSCKGPVARAFSFMKSIEGEMSGARPLKHCAIICPSGLSGSATWDGKFPPKDANVQALYGILRERSVQCAALPREALLDKESLGEYALAVLPSFNSLSLEEIENLAAFASTGGGVFANGPLLFDRAAKAPAKVLKALSRLFGVEAMQPSPEMEAAMEKFRWDQAESAPYNTYLKCREEAFGGDKAPLFAKRMLSVGEYSPLRVLPAASTLADILIGGEGDFVLPGATLNRVGKGLAAFAPAMLEISSCKEGDSLLADFIAHLCEMISSRPKPFEIGGSDLIFTNIMGRQDGDLLLRLVDTDLRREKASVEVQVRLPEGRACAEVKSLPDGASLPFKTEAGCVKVETVEFARSGCLKLSFAKG